MSEDTMQESREDPRERDEEPTRDSIPTTSEEVRQRLVDALRLDLIGPWPGHEVAVERLRDSEPPSRWYLTGFLVPTATPPELKRDADADDDFELVSEDAEQPEESSDDRKPARRGHYPSSIGLSFLVPPDMREIEVTLTWGEYAKQKVEDGGEEVSVWQRTPRTESLRLGLGGEPLGWHRVPNAPGLMVQLAVRPVPSAQFEDHLPPGTRSVSVFLVNTRPRTGSEEERDGVTIFQAQIEVRGAMPFAPRPDLRSAMGTADDARLDDLHYADTPEYATGHGISAEWDLDGEGRCTSIRTSWIPTAEVERAETRSLPGVELRMGTLAALSDGAAAKTALQPMVDLYRAWIGEQRAKAESLGPKRRATAKRLLDEAEFAAKRIEQGIETLADPLALDAFRVMNRAVARALNRRLNVEDPTWRPFQLAFVLLNLRGLVDPKHFDRETVDLLFFPTGGGKTEAYLGLAGFAMVLRRLQNPANGGREGAGVSVMMRYTLRLLTLDQLSRAAGLVCALELEREANPEKYGEWPFEIGLWVGKAATPNIMGVKGDNRSDSARSKTNQFKSDPKHRPSPIPIENCPWCGTKFDADSFSLHPNAERPTRLDVCCMNLECEFSGDRHLPIVGVDEPIYRRLPAFVIATVDKFASLPWVGPSGVLLGGADRFDGQGFYGPSESGGVRLGKPLLPPDLIIQDELHLISGPLGTMAGLYEAAIDALCCRTEGDRTIRPKIVASTATVRNAGDQILALFARKPTKLFPPQGPSRRDSYFAETVPSTVSPARLYAGVAAPGRSAKVAARRVWQTLMCAAQKAYLDAGGGSNKNNPADPYMTALGYFNSLRELGGSRRILEEEVQNTIKGYGGRKRFGEARGLFRDRRSFAEVVELTSRISTNKVAEARHRLGSNFNEPGRVDCAIATNMISVGLDIPRLGLMLVFGQPKTHSEYIQATSRVGRTKDKPGLVVTLFSTSRPRDRSHYERFRHYHETFYRSVEVSSVTPFSARALDRGFAGAMVGLARHRVAALAPPRGVEKIDAVRSQLEEHLLRAFQDRVRALDLDDTEREEVLRSVQNRIGKLLDTWRDLVRDNSSNNIEMQYQPYELQTPKPLLRGMLESRLSDAEALFKANRSLRDVEPEVNLFLKDLPKGART